MHRIHQFLATFFWDFISIYNKFEIFQMPTTGTCRSLLDCFAAALLHALSWSLKYEVLMEYQVLVNLTLEMIEVFVCVLKQINKNIVPMVPFPHSCLTPFSNANQNQLPPLHSNLVFHGIPPTCQCVQTD